MSTTGIELKTRRRGVADTVELLSSMRFAITLLVMIAIAAIIGTIMQQDKAMPDYVNQFGPFWFEVFRKLSLYTVYSAWWFLLILAFLIVSTSLCVARNAPKFMRDMRSWRDSVREESLRNFHHRSEWTAPLDMVPLAQQTATRLVDAGYKTKMVDKAGGVLVAAKKGAGNKFGYIFAHTAIIVILLGGLLDSNLPIRFQQWFMGKTPYAGTGLISAIPPQHRLGLGNPTFRGNTLIPEGQASDTALIQQADGVLVQDLPFTIELRKFIIDFYSTGMPKLFASEVVIRDHETGKAFPATIKVNQPLIYRGVAVYQSSFEDGGSKLKLTGWPMTGTGNKSFAFEGEVGNATELKQGADVYSVEWSGFRPFNVENTSQDNDARAVSKGKSLEEQFAQTLSQHSGSAAKNVGNKDLKNVGPSVQYKLRDKTGQAREYLNYMQPVTLEGHEVFLAGVRNNPSDQFSFLRIPADDEHGLREWMRLRAALADPSLREEAARRYAARAHGAGATGGALRRSCANRPSARWACSPATATRAASSPWRNSSKDSGRRAGKGGDRVHQDAQRRDVGAVAGRARARRRRARSKPTDTHARFLQLATNALSDSFFYGAPCLLQLDEFQEVKASVLQVTRSPGKKVVYLGCVLLIAGHLFDVLYSRAPRLWMWVKPAPDGGTHALMAMSTQRKTLDFEREFDDLKNKLPQSA
jgi:cytochrome c biogenesis protein